MQYPANILKNIPGLYFYLFLLFLFPSNASGGEFSSVQLIKKIDSRANGVDPRVTTNVNGKAFFFAKSNSIRQYELWTSDGTEVGTRLIVETDYHPSSNGVETVAFGNELFFKIHQDGIGSELWASDGTTLGTRLLRDIYVGPTGSNPTHLTVQADHIIFFADSLEEGNELWRSDGTTPGTYLVKDIMPGDRGHLHNGSILPTSVSALVDGIFYFNAIVQDEFIDENTFLGGLELWRSDGTNGGTYLVKDLTPRHVVPFGTIWSKPWALTNFKNKLVYSSSSTGTGQELFHYDHNNPAHIANGPQILKDICPNDGVTCGSANSSDPDAFVVVDNHVYFTADDGIHGRELWRTDGTTSGTHMVVDLVPGEDGSTISEQTAFNGRLFFVYHDGINNHGKELWRTDGTPQGTKMLKDIGFGVDQFNHANDSSPQELTVAGSRMYFPAWAPILGRELWETDGTTEGTRLVQDLHAWDGWGGKPYNLVDINGILFFSAQTRDVFPSYWVTGPELWRVIPPTPNWTAITIIPLINQILLLTE